VCPSGAATGGRGRIPGFVQALCIGCAHCASVCPANAFGLAGEPGEPGEATSSEAFLELCRGRRSTRFFGSGAIPDADIAMLLKPVGYSPTGTNACGIRVIAVSGSDVRAFLFEPLRRRMNLLWKAGLLRALGAFTGRSGQIRKILGGEDLVFRDAPLVLFFFVPRRNATARSDCVIAASLVMLNAQAMGLGTLWNGIAERAYPLVGSWRFPGARGHVLGAVLCTGRPTKAFRPVPPRDWKFLQGVRKTAGGDA
jgi:ferredoxin